VCGSRERGEGPDLNGCPGDGEVLFSDIIVVVPEGMGGWQKGGSGVALCQ
jgi:hypothetical protein